MSSHIQVPFDFSAAGFGPTRTTVWAYANGRLGVRKRLKQAFKLPVISPLGTTLWQPKNGFMAPHSPLTTHYSPLTTHHSLLTTHHSPQQLGHPWGAKGARLKANRAPINTLLINRITTKGAQRAPFFRFYCIETCRRKLSPWKRITRLLSCSPNCNYAKRN